MYNFRSQRRTRRRIREDQSIDGGEMFGIKRRKADRDEQRETLLIIKANITSLINQNHRIQLSISELHTMKLDISSIKMKLFDINEHIKRTDELIQGIKLCLNQQISFDEKLLKKLISDDSINAYFKEYAARMNTILTYMEQTEKIMNNVEKIVDQCLPELTIKLPKKKKATTAAS